MATGLQFIDYCFQVAKALPTQRSLWVDLSTIIGEVEEPLPISTTNIWWIMNGFDLVALLFLAVAAMTGASIITMFAYFRVLGRKRNELPNYKKRKDIYNVDPALAHGHHEPHV